MESQDPFAPPSAPFTKLEWRPVTLAALLWLAFAAAVVVDVLYIGRTRSLFASMYEGMGPYLPTATRFFLDGLWHLAALAAVPLLAILAGAAWRLKAKAGIAALLAVVALAAGWGIAYRWAMRLPVKALEHVFNSGD